MDARVLIADFRIHGQGRRLEIASRVPKLLSEVLVSLDREMMGLKRAWTLNFAGDFLETGNLKRWR